MSDTSKVQMNFHKEVYGAAGNVEGDQIVNAQKQNLVESAAEIQQLLDQLAEQYPTETEAERQEIATKRIRQEIENNPTFKQRLISAFKAGGIEAVKAIFNHPFVNIPVETIRGFIEAE